MRRNYAVKQQYVSVGANMSGTISIGNEQRDIEYATEQWIAQQIIGRRKAGEAVCVRVTINKPNLNVTLASADCPKGGGGGRPPTKKEKEAFDDWAKRGLNGSDFPPGQLIAFLKQIC